ncbi:MAG: c-type cytochrome [Alphaproteobacteria bacterium]|nr:c-type cytochrome [Alphaproteobacteria bacterium]
MTTRLRMVSLGLATAWFASPAQAQMPPVAANGCLGCHGVDGQGANGIPAIMRVQSKADFTATMKLFAENKKPGTIMGRISRGYTDQDIAELAAWFGKP